MSSKTLPNLSRASSCDSSSNISYLSYKFLLLSKSAFKIPFAGNLKRF